MLDFYFAKIRITFEYIIIYLYNFQTFLYILEIKRLCTHFSLSSRIYNANCNLSNKLYRKDL